MSPLPILHMGSTSVSRPAGPSKPGRRYSGHSPLDIPGSAAASAAAGGIDADGSNPGPSAVAPAPSSPVRPLSVDGRREEDAALRRAAFLSREEVLRRRLRRVRQLAKYYRRQYWGFMEAVRVRHRDYYWNFGRSPVEGAEGAGGGEGERNGVFAAVEGSGESGRVEVGFGAREAGAIRKRDRNRCGAPGCKMKPMALTRYCHLHILADQKQRLYKACVYPIKSVHTGPVTCGKPVLRAQPLSYCPTHIQRAQKNVSQAMKKAGLSQNPNKPPRIHVVIAESIRQIQAKRRETLISVMKQPFDEEETTTQASHGE